MTPSGDAWNEAGLSEDPAVVLLEQLGYAYAPPETLEGERESLRDVVLVGRLSKAIKKLNPWISDDNLHKAMRVVTSVLQVASTPPLPMGSPASIRSKYRILSRLLSM